MKKILVAVLLSGCVTSAWAGVNVQRAIPLAEDNDISDAIKNECTLGEKLADSVQRHAEGEVTLVDALDIATGTALQLEIVDSVNVGNFALGRQTFTKIRGTLYRDGQKVASFKARRNSMGGAWGQFKGACAVLGRTVEKLGEDVDGWLDNPKDGATIGD